jgi:hypothetical protein
MGSLMKYLVLCLSVLSVFSMGCKRSVGLGVKVPKERVVPYGLVRLDESVSYLIDPRTETCILLYQDFSVNGGDGITSTPVDCAKLKKSLPDAGQFIKWIP